MKPNPRNPKLHANDLIGKSIARFGMVEPVVIDQRTGFIMSGHGRVETLQKMLADGATPPEGITVAADGDWLIPAVTSWASRNDIEAEAALIALNRTTEMGGWESQSLADILVSLTAADALSGVGYTDTDLSLLLKKLDAQTQFTTDQSGAIDEFDGISGITGGAEVGYFRKLMVVFGNDADVRSFYDKLGKPFDATERSFGWPQSLPRNKAANFDG